MEKLKFLADATVKMGEEESVFDAQTTKNVIDSITKIPSLGTVGIIAAIVLAIITIVAWYWWNNIHNKTVQKETEKQRAKDQADTVTDNQDASQKWDDAEKRSEEERTKEGDDGKKDVPTEPSE